MAFIEGINSISWYAPLTGSTVPTYSSVVKPAAILEQHIKHRNMNINTIEIHSQRMTYFLTACDEVPTSSTTTTSVTSTTTTTSSTTTAATTTASATTIVINGRRYSAPLSGTSKIKPYLPVITVVSH